MALVKGDSNNANDAAVLGVNTAQNGRGVYGESQKGYGVLGHSNEQAGVIGQSEVQYGVYGETNAEYHAGVVGINNNTSDKAGMGVLGKSKGVGVWGESTTWNGIYGVSKSEIGGAGVLGENTGNGIGVSGLSKTSYGIYGKSETGHGIWGESANGSGVTGIGYKWHGVYGQSEEQIGVLGQSTKGRGVVGVAKEAGTGVEGSSINGAGVWGASANGIGVYGKGGRVAAFFEGDVEVTGDIRLLNADFAEDFDVPECSEPGEVMVLTEAGTLTQSEKAYDRKVVGVISGAGHYKPGIILDKQNNAANRKPIAMMGKVFCKVDADISPIETGDLLTTSDIPGYAMRATDPFKAFGAVIGKALASMKEGKGLIPILVVLQ